VVGVFTDVSKHVTQHFKRAGDAILLIRTAKPSLAASEYAALFGVEGGMLTPVDLERERALVEGLVGAVEQGLIRSAHDVSEGGLAVAIAEACFSPRVMLGAEIDLGRNGITGEAELFGEGPSTVIVSADDSNVAVIERMFEASGIECRRVGRVTEEARLKIASTLSVDEDVKELARIYEDALPRRLRQND
jgi:phosphoribosylformylglycinamidine synthase subunit PurL